MAKKDILTPSYIDPFTGLQDLSSGKYDPLKVKWNPNRAYQRESPTEMPGIDISKYSDYWSNKNDIQLIDEVSLDEQRAQRQSAGEQLWHGAVKMGVLAGTTFADNTLGLLVGAGNVIQGGEDGDVEFNDFIDNPFSRWMLELQKASEEAFPNYYTKEGNESFAGIIPGTEGSANFWGDKVLKNLGFTIGAVAAGALTGVAAEKAILKPMVANIFKGSADLKKFKDAAGLLQAVEKGEISGLKITESMLKSARNLKRAQIGVQMAGATLGSVGESRVEALHASDEFRERESAKIYEEFSKGTISAEERDKKLDDIEDQAKYLQNTVFAGNMAVLSASNMFQFKDAFSGGFKAAKELDRGLGRFIKKEVKDYILDAAKGIKRVRRTASALGKGLANAQVEGLEEQMQQFVSSSSQSFWGAQLDHQGAQRASDIMNAIKDGFQASFGSASGWEQYFIGAFTGAIGSPTFTSKGIGWAGGVAGSLREEFGKEAEAKALIPQLNKSLKDMSDQYKYLTRYLKYENEKEAALADDDIFSYKNAEHDQFISNVITFAKAGKINDLVDMYEGMKQADPQEIRKLLQITKDAAGNTLAKPIDPLQNYSDDDIKRRIFERSNNLRERAERILDIKRRLDIEYSNKDDKFREELLHYASTIDNVDERIKNINSNLSKLGVTDIEDLSSINEIDRKTIETDIKDLKALNKRRENYVRKLTGAIENPEKLEKKLNKEENKVVEDQNESSIKEFNGKYIKDKKTGQNYLISINNKTGDRVLQPVDEFGEIEEGKETITHSVGSLSRETLLDSYDEFTPTVKPVEEDTTDLYSGLSGDVDENIQQVPEEEVNVTEEEIEETETQEETEELEERKEEPESSEAKRTLSTLNTRLSGSETSRTSRPAQFVGKRAINDLTPDKSQRRYSNFVKSRKFKGKGYKAKLVFGSTLYGEDWDKIKEQIIEEIISDAAVLGNTVDRNIITEKVQETIFAVIVDKDGNYITEDGTTNELNWNTIVFTTFPNDSEKTLSGFNKLATDKGYTREQIDEVLNEFRAKRAEIKEKISSGKDVFVNITGKSNGIQNYGYQSDNLAIVLNGHDYEIKVNTLDTIITEEGQLEFKNTEVFKGDVFIEDKENGNVYQASDRKINDEEVSILKSLIDYIMFSNSFMIKNSKGERVMDVDGNQISVSRIFSFYLGGHNFRQSKNSSDKGFSFVRKGDSLVVYHAEKDGSVKELEVLSKNEYGVYEYGNGYAEFTDIITKAVHNVNNSKLKNKLGVYIPIKVVADKSSQYVEFDDTYSGEDGYKSYLLDYKDPVLRLSVNKKYQEVVNEFFPPKESDAQSLAGTVLLNQNLNFNYDVEEPAPKSAEQVKTVEAPTEEKPKAKRRRADRGIGRTATEAKISEDLEAARKWFEERFPNIPYHVVRKLIEGKYWGQFRDAAVYVSELAETGTTFHEAWHVVTHVFLTEKEITDLYNDYADKNGIERKIWIENGKLTEAGKQIEEALADQFMNWKLGDKKVSRYLKDLFQRILDFIKDFLGLKSSDITDIFRKIDRGYYANSAPIFAISGNSNRVPEGLELNQNQANALNRSVSYMVIKFYFDKEHPERLKSLSTGESSSEITDEAYQYAKDWIEEQRDIYEEDGLTDDANVLTHVLDKFDIVKQFNQEYLKSNFNIEMEEDIDAEQNSNDKMQLRSESGLKKSTKESASNKIKLLLGTLPALEMIDNEFVNKLNIIGLPEVCDFGSTWNVIVNKLSGTESLLEMDTVLKELESKYPELNYLRQRLNINGGANITESEVEFQTAFYQLARNYYDYYMDSIGRNGKQLIFNSTHNTISTRKIDEWSGNVRMLTKGSSSLYKENDEGHIMYSSADFIKKYPVVTRDNVFQFLEDIGIKYENAGRVLNHLSENGEMEAFLTRANGIMTYVRRGMAQDSKSVGNIFHNPSLDMSGNIKYFANIEAVTNPDYIENSHYNHNGDLMYNIGLHSFVSRTMNTINRVHDKAQLISRLPYLNEEETEFLKNSVLLKNGGILFDINGKRTNVKLVIGFHEGSKTEDGNKVDDFNRLREADKVRIKLNTFFNNGGLFMLRPGDNDQERVVHFNNKTLITPQQVNSKAHLNILFGYFIDELHSAVQYTFNTVEIKNLKAKAFQGTLISLLEESEDKVLKDNLEDIILKLKSSESEEEAKALLGEFLSRNDIRQMFNKEMERLITRETNFWNSEAEKNGLYFKDSSGKIHNRGLLLKNTEINVDSIKTKIRLFAINELIWTIEQTKLFIGDPRQFKSVEDMFKRVSSAVSTKRGIADDHHIQEWEDRNLKREDGKTNRGTAINGMATILTATFADIKSSARSFEAIKKLLGSKSKAYKDYTSADAQGMVSLDEYRSILLKSGQWTFGKGSHEELYQYEMQKSQGIKSPQYIDTKGRITHTIEKPKLVFKPLKVQYYGPLAEKGNFTNIIFKTAIYPILPSMAQKYPELKKIREQMKRQKIGIITFESANKIGYKTKGNKAQNHKTEGDLITQNTYTKFWGIQVDNALKPKSKVITGTQMMKQVIAGIANLGFLSDRMRVLRDEYIDLNRKRIEAGVERLKEKLGLNETLIDGNYVIKDFEKFKSMLRDEAMRRNLSDNVIDGIDLISEVKGIDTLVNREKAENLLFALADSMVISQKRFGNSSVQVSSVMIDEDLKFYDIESSEDTIPMEIICGNYFKEFDSSVLENLDERLRRIVGFRIPTQGPSSIDVARVKDFLPENISETVILPEEIVAKQGGDFDFDKFNMYFPNYYVGSVDGKRIPIYIEWSSTETGLRENYESYRRQRWISQKEMQERWSYETEEEFDSSLKEISYEEFVYAATLNRIQEIQAEILLAGENKENFLLPVDSKNLKHAAAVVTEIVDRSKNKREKPDNVDEWYENYLDSSKPNKILSAKFVRDIGNRFQTGSQAIGVGALFSTFVIACQHHNVQIGNTIIPMKHNTDMFAIQLGAKNNVSEQLIHDLFNEWLSVFVDAPKEPHMNNLGVDMQNVNIALYLTAAGVNPIEIGLFLNQPIVVDFFTSQSVRESMTNYANMSSTEKAKWQSKVKAEFLDKWIKNRGGISKEDKEAYINKEFDKELLTKMILERYSRDSQFLLQQYQILESLFSIQEAVKVVSKGINAMSVDTNGAGKNVSELMIRDIMISKAIEGPESPEAPYMINYNSILEEESAFLNTYYKSLKEFENIFKPFVRILRDPVLMEYVKERINLFIDEAASRDDIIKAIDNIKSDIFSYLITTKEFEIDGYQYNLKKDRKELLINGKTPKELIAMKEKYPDNALLKAMFPVFHRTKYYTNSKVQHADFIRYYASKLDKIESDALTSAWEELFESEPAFAHDLLKISIIQTGIKNSPMAFWNLIPAKIYDKILSKVLMMDEINAFKALDRKNFIDQIQLNNTNNDLIVKTKKTLGREFRHSPETMEINGEMVELKSPVKRLGFDRETGRVTSNGKKIYEFVPLDGNTIHVYDIRRSMSMQIWNTDKVQTESKEETWVEDVEFEEIGPLMLPEHVESSDEILNDDNIYEGISDVDEISEEKSLPLQTEKSIDLGMTVGEYMKTLSKEGRAKLRDMIANKEIEFKCR